MTGLLRRIYIHALPAPLKRLARTSYLLGNATLFRWRHPGSDCTCNFCGFRAGRFAPGGYAEGVLVEKQVIGGGYRPHARCPKCYSLDRERQILVVLEDHLPIDDSWRVLHVAPERNLNEVIRARFTNHVDECDLEPEAYAWAKNISKQDLTQLDLPDDSFDLVLCNHVLEHIPADRQAMAELYRVVKPGGYAILQIPYSESIPTTEEDLSLSTDEERLRTYGQVGHVRLYERDDYISRVTSQGWQSRFLGPTAFPASLKLGLDRREGIFLFQK
ncbi:MAG: methyltransferase domain-containing protein [Planctomycetota bacterium]